VDHRKLFVKLSGVSMDHSEASNTQGHWIVQIMNINSVLVKQLRSEKSWSQDELAIASGLNLRTVQRIEKEATASLQSKKALASVFGIAVKDLEHMESATMQKHEYKTLDIEWKQGFLAGIKTPPLPDLKAILNREGQEGWRLVQILSPNLLMSAKAVEKMVAIFERPIVE
jgi:DNA-binding XRE family transcriptional regulator